MQAEKTIKKSVQSLCIFNLNFLKYIRIYNIFDILKIKANLIFIYYVSEGVYFFNPTCDLMSINLDISDIKNTHHIARELKTDF